MHAQVDVALLYAFVGLWLSANLLYALSVYRRLWRGRRAFSQQHARAHGFLPADVSTAPTMWCADG